MVPVHFPCATVLFAVWLPLALASNTACSVDVTKSMNDNVVLLQSSKRSSTRGEEPLLEADGPIGLDAHSGVSSTAKTWPLVLLQDPSIPLKHPERPWFLQHGAFSYKSVLMHQGAIGVVMIMFTIAGVMLFFPGRQAIRALSLGVLYICVSAAMIETNKYLMLPGRFPYPMALTSNHMLTSFILASILRCICPSAFPALDTIKITPWFCLSFLPIGAAFATSVICANITYKYLSVSFLQMMKQGNIAVIYALSALCGLESLRRCSVVLLIVTLLGTSLTIHGEMKFQWVGFMIQLASSLSEACKVVIQGVLMSGVYKLDPLTMVLFMAPACLLSNSLPLLIFEGPRVLEIIGQFQAHIGVVCFNAILAFALNVIVAQCIKDLSPVGYLLCGVVKDVCVIVSSAYFLGDSLAPMQIVGFSIALIGVASYSLYKQNQDCFEEDRLGLGFHRVFQKFFFGDNQHVAEKLQKLDTGEVRKTQDDL